MAVVVKGRFRDTEIDGVLVAPKVSTRRPGSPRWFELELYQLASGKFLVHRASYSLIYHHPNTACTVKTGRQRGDPISSLDELPDDAEPCTQCRPPWPEKIADMADAGQLMPVRYEFPRHTFDECATPADVVDNLITIRNRDGTVHTFTSAPVEQLLEGAARNPAFRDAARPSERYA